MAIANAKVRKFRPQTSISKSDILDNQVRVSTPENIAFQYEIVGPSRRLMAYLLDVIITLFVYAIAAIAVSFLFGWLALVTQGTALGPVIELLVSLAVTIFAVGGFLSMWFYGAYMETYYNGQTFGKMLANIRSISTDGSAIDGTQATLRNFFRLLDVSPFLPLGMIFGSEVGWLPFPIFAIGILSMTLSRKYQRLGDFVANTIVVSETKKWTHGLAQFQDPRVPQLAELLPDNFIVSPSLAKALAEYVDRRQVLPYQRANEIAIHIGRPLIEHFGLAPDTNSDLLLCSLYYKTFVHENDSIDNPFLLNPVAKSLLDSGQTAPSSGSTTQPSIAEEVTG